MDFPKETHLEYVKKSWNLSGAACIVLLLVKMGTTLAVTGGEETEKLTDMDRTIIVKYPNRENNVFKPWSRISAYTSASTRL